MDLSGIDLMFIDTEHNYEQIAQEYALYGPFLRNGAMVVLDDIHLNDGMTRFWNEIPHPKVDTGDALHWSGFGIFQHQACPYE